MDDWLAELLSKPTTSVPNAGKALGLSRNSSYEAAKRGEILVLEFGRSKKVPTAWLRQVLRIGNSGEAA